jgi:hypothetical protein
MSYRIGNIAVLLGLVACGSPQTETSSPAAATAKPSPEAKASWSVVPKTIRYDEDSKTVFVQVGVTVDNQGLPPREKEAFIGVTLAAVDGEEFDLAIQTVFPDQMDQPLLFSAGVEKPIEEVLVGLWDHKVQPCDSERPGCKTYGFLLDGSLASWPPNLYVDHKRQRILPHQVSFQWVGPEDVRLASQLEVGSFMRTYLEVFGSTLVVEPSKSGAPPEGSIDGPVIQFKHAKDQVLAQTLAVEMTKEKSLELRVERKETLATDFAVFVPASK